MSMIIPESLSNLAVGASVVTVLIAIFSAMKNGVIRQIKLGSLEIQATDTEKKQAELIIHRVVNPEERSLPFETEQLANYYSEVLARSKINMWFSLIFASIGFLIIVFAALKFTASDINSAVVQLVSGTIIDSVAALFFVQSNKAQHAMAAFFEKLRLDRQQSDAKLLCESITDENLKNVLKVQMSLHLSGIPKFDEISKNIIDSCVQKQS